MTGRGIDQVFPSSVDPRIHESYVKDARDYVRLAETTHGHVPRNISPRYIWGDCFDIWKRKKTDLKIINLETAITTNESYRMEKGIHYRMHPDNVSALKAAGVDICTLANNHVLDWDYPGLFDTMASLEKNQILYAGAGKDSKEAEAPAVFENAEGRVLVFGLCFPSSGVPLSWKAARNNPGVFLLENSGPDSLDAFKESVSHFKRKGDVIIASIHWGSNWGYEISTEQRNFAHQLIDNARVDIVHGHSSHHPRPLEFYKGHPIFYGCGDFINDYEGIGGYEEYRSDLTLMYFVDFSFPFKVKRIEMVCLLIRNFQLHLTQRKDLEWMYETLNQESRIFHTPLILTDDEIVAIPLKEGE